MATRRRIPMVGDNPPEVVVPLEDLKLEVSLRAERTEVSSSEEAKEFDWDAWSGLMIFALIIPRNVECLVDYWKANANMLDWAKKVKPEIYEVIRLAFAARKLQVQGDKNG